MRAAIDAFQEHYIHFAQQIGNRVDDLDAHPLHGLGVLRDAIEARWNVGTPARISSDNSESRQVSCGLGIIKNLRELRHVRRIESNDADADDIGRRGRRFIGGMGKACDHGDRQQKDCNGAHHGSFLPVKGQQL